METNLDISHICISRKDDWAAARNSSSVVAAAAATPGKASASNCSVGSIEEP